MKVALLLQDENFSNLDLSQPEKGNMGIGGTQYCFLMLARYLSLRYPTVNVTIYHFSNQIFPKEVVSKKIEKEEDALYESWKSNVDLLILRGSNLEKIISMNQNFNVPIITWAHNYLLADELNLMSENEDIKRVVFVGKEQYDRYIDHPVIRKSTYIYNMFNSKSNLYTRNEDYDANVCYVGSLVPSKGFHLLAKQWKKIINEVPNAKLYIIGSGKLYNRNTKLGELGIAEKSYEEKILSYLSNDNGLLDSVHFCGILGQEKFNVFNNTAVGVINPTGKTETFGISAVEMEACGVPIVTVSKNGLLDTIIHEKTGLLYRRSNGLHRNIIKLLKNRKLNNRLGYQAKSFVNETFDPEKIISEWYQLLVDVNNNVKAEYLVPQKNYANNYKLFRIVNRKLKQSVLFSWLPPIINIETKIKKIIQTITR